MMRSSGIPDSIRKALYSKKVKAELEPLALGFFSLGKKNRRYIDFKSSLDNWNKRFAKTMKTIGTVESMQRLTIPMIREERTEGDRRLLAVVNSFRYLGLVESFGAQFVDLLILLLVANGYEFHVEREHEAPRIVHATSLKDLQDARLGPKVRFLERCGLKDTSRFIDVDLRNSIAHLDFEINEEGNISAKSNKERKKNININRKISEFYERFMVLFFIFNEIQEHVFGGTSERVLKVRKKGE